MAEGLDVRGGVGGIGARLADLSSYARTLDAAAEQLATIASQLAREAAGEAVVRAALLCPVEAAAAEAALLSAAAGRRGAFVVSARLQALARATSSAATLYRATEARLARSMEAGAIAGGFAVGMVAPPLAAAAMTATLGSPLLVAALYVRRDDLSDAAAATIVDHPWLLEPLSRLAPGALQGAAFATAALLPGGPLGLVLASGMQWPALSYRDTLLGLLAVSSTAGRLTDDSRFRAEPAGAPRRVRLPRKRWLSSLVAAQAALGRRTAQVQVTRVDRRTGSPAYVVQIPGTQGWDVRRGSHPFDAVSNVHLIAGAPRTSVQRAVEDAMSAAGIRPDDPVLLAGHSQGGMAAAALAADANVRERYDVRGVVTIGSPVARFAIPRDVAVLSLEHEQDVVPLLDSAGNPDRASWVTVSRDLATSGVAGLPDAAEDELGEAHGLAAYWRTASAVDQAARRGVASGGDPSLRAWHNQMASLFSGRGMTYRFALRPDG